jgi:hypothetical protein
VAGHAGIFFNELADAEAEKARVLSHEGHSLDDLENRVATSQFAPLPTPPYSFNHLPP